MSSPPPLQLIAFDWWQWTWAWEVCILDGQIEHYKGFFTKVFYWSLCICGYDEELRVSAGCVDILLIRRVLLYSTKKWGMLLRDSNLFLVSTTILSIYPVLCLYHSFPMRSVREGSKKRARGDDQINIALRKRPSTVCLPPVFHIARGLALSLEHCGQ